MEDLLRFIKLDHLNFIIFVLILHPQQKKLVVENLKQVMNGVTWNGLCFLLPEQVGVLELIPLGATLELFEGLYLFG